MVTQCFTVNLRVRVDVRLAVDFRVGRALTFLEGPLIELDNGWRKSRGGQRKE